MSLPEFIHFVAKCDGLIASGTGPLHLAAATDINTLGLFPPRNGINPTKWTPIGRRATYLVHPRPFYKACFHCRNSVGCACMKKITVPQVKQVILNWQKLDSNRLTTD